MIDLSQNLCIHTVVLEWAGAGDLKRQVRKAREKQARFDEALIWKIFAQIADAVRYMHSRDPGPESNLPNRVSPVLRK